MPRTRAKSSKVEDGSVINSAVIPDSCHSINQLFLMPMKSFVLTDIVRILPLVSQLTVVLFNDQLQEPIEKALTLIWRHVIDALSMVSNCKKALPARDGVGADNWMAGREGIAYVVW